MQALSTIKHNSLYGTALEALVITIVQYALDLQTEYGDSFSLFHGQFR